MEKNIEYKKLIDAHSPKSSTLKNSFFAFVFGGFICAFSQTFVYFITPYIEEEKAYLLATLSLIVIASLLTSLGVFDKIARVAGAGTLVPVTGFSNSVTSAAIDSKSEGFVLGVGSKIFTIAGPVILYGIASGTIYGFIYYFYTLLR